MEQKIIKTEGVPIRLWNDDIEDGALQQAKNAALLPFAFHHIALMPDVHEGFGIPIGSVLAADGYVVPNAVGVDIGCGMCAVKTNINAIDKSKLKDIIQKIKQLVPLGFKHHKRQQDENLMPAGYDTDKMEIVRREYKSVLFQLGTLGGGNHFIEIQQDKNNNIWFMVHSGSRNIGLKVAEYHHKLAIKYNENRQLQTPFRKELAYFPANSSEGKAYLTEMNYCVDFAFANRKLIIERIKEIITDVFKGNISFEPLINIAHNYAAFEKHYGKLVLVHRKGATSAKTGEKGIIPGSQGSKSYIVEGLGNPLSFMSCSHGAGRKLGRKEAQRKLNLKEEIELMEKSGILHSIKSVKDLDEATGAYKDIDTVMKNQNDLVKILMQLQPLAVIKG